MIRKNTNMAILYIYTVDDISYYFYKNTFFFKHIDNKYQTILETKKKFKKLFTKIADSLTK